MHAFTELFRLRDGPYCYELVTDDRTFQRRRLASLAAVLALVLGVGSLVGDRDGDAVDVTTEVAAGADVVRAASVGSPTGVRELLSETTTTLVEATGATTTTEAPPALAPPTTTSSTEAPTTTAAASAQDAPADTTPEPTVRAFAAEEPAPTPTSEAPRRESPTTTAPAPPTTAAPAPTTTQAPAQGSEGYAYDDPRSTQVWYDLARCESGGNWSINTGNGYYGGLQFSLPTWESVGGTGHPHEHPAATQIEHGRKLQARQGWGAWPHCSQKLGLR